jgi:predicted DNA-binding protein with PD1-like motif
MYLVQIRPGQEVLATIRDDAKARGVSNAAIVSLIGAVDLATISNMVWCNTGTENVMTKYTQPMELSGSGEIVAGQPHLHVVVSMVNDVVLGGHLWLAEVVYHFVHAYVWPFE